MKQLEVSGIPLPRREFIGAIAAGLTWPLLSRAAATDSNLPADAAKVPFGIRTITAGIPLKHAADFATFDSAHRFLEAARQEFTSQGFNIQTIRMASQPLAGYLPSWNSPEGLASLAALDKRAVEAEVGFAIGPVLPNRRSLYDHADG